MPKMRVHELATELNIKSKDIIEALSNTEHAVTSAQSGLSDDACTIVRNKFSKKQAAPKAEAPKSEPVKAESTKSDEHKSDKPKSDTAKSADAERPKKKASISAVFNAQYSKQSRRPEGKNNNGQQRNRNNDRGPRRNNNARPEAHSIIKPRPVGERAMRPISERTAGNEEEIIVKPSQNREEKKERLDRNNRPERQSRPNNDRNDNNRSGDRRNNNRNSEGRSFDRNNNRGDNNNNRGDRNNFRNNDRNNDRNSDRNNGFRRDNKSSEMISPVEEVSRGKEGSNRNNDRRQNSNRRQNDHDKLGKRQENYINLEKHGGKKKPQQQPQQPKEDENEIKTITLPEKIVIRDLADKMKVQSSAIVKKLFLKGEMVTVNSELSFEEAEELALEFNFICEQEEKVDVIAELLKEDEENEADMVPRPPVVCVMGHVDHGKTSLLDAIRKTDVISKEAGGITQHIGAYMVKCGGEKITFLDTPGHEAFTSMRMRGAKSTDIAILVVAADDGVMPQTVEAINHAKAAGVEIIVAVNKIDKPGANVERVKQELIEYDLVAEDWGGSTVFVPVSAKSGEGIENLLEMILLTAEVMELKANPNRSARGIVIEAQLDRGRGPVATILVQKGTLKVGDHIVIGSAHGKVRAMMDDKGRRVKEAKPSTPVEIIGLNEVPDAGEVFITTKNEKEARTIVAAYIDQSKAKLIEDTKSVMSLDGLFDQIQAGNIKELNIIVKADVQGSVEAIKQSLLKLSNEEVAIRIIHGGVGAITESDVSLAIASSAIIIGFNVRPDNMAKSTAEREKVDLRLYKVIYDAIADIEGAMKGLLDPIFEEKVIGHAEVRQIFKASDVGIIAGSYVLDGKIVRGCKARISRGGEQIFEGNLASLKRFKDDVKEVNAGYECGLVFEGFKDIAVEDQVELYSMVEIPR